MKIILQSKELDFVNELNYNKVHIFTQFFIPNNKNRYKEIKYCLQENVKYVYRSYPFIK